MCGHPVGTLLLLTRRQASSHVPAAHGVTLLVSRAPRPVPRAWAVTVAAVVTGLVQPVPRSAAQAEQAAWIAVPVRLPS